jgi:hypothetical protein
MDTITNYVQTLEICSVDLFIRHQEVRVNSVYIGYFFRGLRINEVDRGKMKEWVGKSVSNVKPEATNARTSVGTPECEPHAMSVLENIEPARKGPA